MPKRIFSGAQPTGNLHIGNYLGALRNWVALQHEYESFFCVVNLHALTIPQDPKLLAAKTKEVARIYLAAGIDPKVSTVFVQSDVQEHAELAWILNCVARVSELERMTQFKDKAKKQRENVHFKKWWEQTNQSLTLPSWLTREAADYSGQVKNWPMREEISFPINEQLIVELYSR